MVLKPASYTRLSALLFAEICAEAGLPPGVFNVVTGNGAFGSKLATHDDVDKIGFTGSTEVSVIMYVLVSVIMYVLVSVITYVLVSVITYVLVSVITYVLVSVIMYVLVSVIMYVLVSVITYVLVSIIMYVL